VACGAGIPSPEEKNEYEYENEYEKKHDFMRILDLKIVLVLQSPSLTLPRKMGRGAAVLPQRGRLFTLGPAN